MVRKRTTVSALDAEAYIELIKMRFASWIYDEDGNEVQGSDLTAVENWDGNGHWGICWESNAPYEWAYYASVMSLGYQEREPEFGFRLPIVKVPAKLSHIFSEPYNGYVLMLYLED
jgi:hypothetical protein